MKISEIVILLLVLSVSLPLQADEAEGEVAEIVVRGLREDDPCRVNLIGELFRGKEERLGTVDKTNYNNLDRNSGSMRFTAKCEGVPNLYWHDKRCKNTKFHGLKAHSDSVEVYREEGEDEIVIELTENQICDKIAKSPQHIDNYQNGDCGLREFNYRKQYTVALSDIWDARNETMMFSCHERNCKMVLMYDKSGGQNFLFTRKDSAGKETTKFIINNKYNTNVDFDSDEPDGSLRQCYPD